ncbi:MAG: hypothetical protein L6R42_002662 [Xanthoria sp. 1 TBL-2021]|nr:MAG: hypothetical protein L6R42_002662 [Xanthoria sp. 1 TBL-2021]
MPFHSRHADDGEFVYWPKHLLPEALPSARVFAYGYDTKVRHTLGAPVSKNNVYDIASDFLRTLETERRSQPSRPLMFIAHSLGGIVVKELLRQSYGFQVHHSHLHRIYKATAAVMFFGTPHGGADPRGFREHVVEQVARAAGLTVNEQIVSTLLPTSERLRELRDEFGLMARREGWIIYSFQEQYGVQYLGGKKASHSSYCNPVKRDISTIEDVSSCLGDPSLEITQHIASDHMDMCRFSGVQDHEYRKVIGALDFIKARMSEKQVDIEQSSATPKFTNNQRQLILDAMWFRAIEARYMTIKPAHAKTCKWLLQRSEYQDWLNVAKISTHHGLFWIKGKPGSGKSTLLKFAVQSVRKAMKSAVVICFFFNARGEDLEKSTLGMYRSLLSQLLRALPDIQEILDHFTPVQNSDTIDWHIDRLRSLFAAAIQRLGERHLICFIDALNESDEDQIRDLVVFLEELGRPAASSPINFLVALVVQILNKEYDHGRVHSLRRRLKEIPDGLDKLFEDILTRDNAHFEELILCLQWILYAERPLKREELYYAILSGTDEEALTPWDPEIVTAQDIDKFILSCSKGLAETTKSKSQTVQFIHESVRHFLLGKNRMTKLRSELDFGQSNERLKWCCYSVLKKLGSADFVQSMELLKVSTSSAPDHCIRKSSKTPLFDYAVQNIRFHAEKADHCGISQEPFQQIIAHDQSPLGQFLQQSINYQRVVLDAKFEEDADQWGHGCAPYVAPSLHDQAPEGLHIISSGSESELHGMIRALTIISTPMNAATVATANPDQNMLVHNEAWDVDSCSASSHSEVFSALLTPSSVSDGSSASPREKLGSEAAEHLASLLIEDPNLNSLYATGISGMSPERFHTNHDQLLVALFKDLRTETRNTVELATVRGLRYRNQRLKITSLIHNAFEPVSSVRQQAMTILRDQRPNRMQVLSNYLGGSTPDDSLQGGDAVPDVQDDESEDGRNSDSSNADEDRPNWQNTDRTNVQLESLESFITQSKAFARFRSNLGYLVRPPTLLSEALGSRDVYTVQSFLTRNFVSAASSGYEWLHELDEAGYSKTEIAELLLENTSDSPWIYFIPRLYLECQIQLYLHIPGCAHEATTNIEQQFVQPLGQDYPSVLHTDLHRQVEELCGIGGVIPSSRVESSWHGRVIFKKQNCMSLITYAAKSENTPQHRMEILDRTAKVLNNFCAAVAVVQSNRLCCNSFTAFFQSQDMLLLRRIELHHVKDLMSHINKAVANDSTEAAIRLGARSAKHILHELAETIPDTLPDINVHYCALAAQFLCVAFLSYTQAHVGPASPFFLDTPQLEMMLFGSQHMPLGSQHVPEYLAIRAGLCELTCLAEMTNQPVLAFFSAAKPGETRPGSESTRFDVQSNAEDILDTWGPGYFVYNKADPSRIHGIALGGGFVFLANSTTSGFHWSKGRLSEAASQASFDHSTVMRIGSPIRVNGNCGIDEAACRGSSCCALEQLGTKEIFWEPQERQVGLHAGQYVNGSLLQTWKKNPGTTLKQYKLQQDDWRLIDFLEQYWGLQVSFCTSVARRVSLRELIADLLPIFVSPFEQDDWQELVDVYQVIQAFTQGNLIAWLRLLSRHLQVYVLKLVRTILQQLQYTGFDRRTKTLVIAWPCKGDIERGLKIPCKEQTYWAQILADAEDCATFAYVTLKCLETNHVKCRGSLRAWQNASKMLVTEMSPSRPQGEIVTAPTLGAITTAATATTQWELEDKRIYFVKKLDTLLQVKVERPKSSSSDVAHLVVAASTIPPGWWKRVLLKEEQKRTSRIRERQAIGEHAERVIVRAG